MAQHNVNAAVQTLERLTDQEKRLLLAWLTRVLQGNTPMRSPMQQRAALLRLRQELAALPVINPTDGGSNRQHDRLLYGTP